MNPEQYVTAQGKHPWINIDSNSACMPFLQKLAEKGDFREEAFWMQILREDTTAIKGRGKDSMWSLSLFHLPLTYAALFWMD